MSALTTSIVMYAIIIACGYFLYKLINSYWRDLKRNKYGSKKPQKYNINSYNYYNKKD